MPPLQPPRSPETRQQHLHRLASEPWDLIVVGGGITGAAAARDAALRGLRVVMLEQFDLAYGTSSRSSRLVHGGLRYLESFELSLVHEGLVERKRLFDSAPGLAQPVQFIYPVYQGDPDAIWKVSLGTWAYDALAGRYGIGHRKLLSPSDVARAEPALRQEAMEGAVSYYDGATHDARLTVSVALSAARAGALILTRTRVVQLLRAPDGRVHGVELENVIGGSRLTVEAPAVALCTGPWQDLHADIPPIIRTARGTHISVPAACAPVRNFVALHSPRDGRLTFALPHGEYTVFGTTDDDDPVEPGSVTPRSADIDYLLDNANAAFPACKLRREDVRGVWAGLRPLIADPEHDDPDELSRRHQVVPGGPGLWILAGGKLTTHRRMAEDLLDAVIDGSPGLEATPCRTAQEPLLEGDLNRGRELLKELGIEDGKLEGLVYCYGTRLEAIAELVTSSVESGQELGSALFATCVRLAAEEEWALSLDDLLLRRLLPGPLDLKSCLEQLQSTASELAPLLGWDDAQTKEQVASTRALIQKELRAAGL